MAINNFAITVQLGGSPNNPINATTFQIVTPWGQTPVCYSLREALYEIIGGKGGTEYTGAMGAYFSAQTLYGATGSGPVGYVSATTWGGSV